MAIFYPSFDIINKLKVPPTEGERTLLLFLQSVLDDSFEVFFNPYLNGDRPDVIIMRKGYGVMIIEVKDWNLDNFKLNDKYEWVYAPNNSVIKKSPIEQVLKYKRNLFDLHVENLLLMKINNYRHLNIVSCAVYFHCANQQNIEDFLLSDNEYKNYLSYKIDLIGNDGLNEDSFKKILEKRRLIKFTSIYFTDTLYNNFCRLLSPPLHMKSQGVPYLYNDKQKEIIYSTRLEQRVRGVFGAGKTTVLAARAVQAYKRALTRNCKPRILILTFNITLKNFIHDKLNRVDETFRFEDFIIINYHQFINAELNNLNISIDVPETMTPEHLSIYLENNYYGNIGLFEMHKSEIKKYDAVFIDEIQDYHRAWMDIVKNYFRDPQGDYVLFGDVKQNIYNQKTLNKDVVTNVKGVNELKYCYRSDFKIRDLAYSFQRNIFKDKYDIDDFAENGIFKLFGQELEKEGYINYIYLQGENPVKALYNIIRGNILNKNSTMSPNDITILGYTIPLLRIFDLYYRYSCREKTNTMFETIEAMYMVHLNELGRNNNNQHNSWFNSICVLMKEKFFPNKYSLSEYDKICLRKHIAILFAVLDLYLLYKEAFKNRLCEECEKCGINLQTFTAFANKYADKLTEFKKEVYKDDYKQIRDNKKLHFWMNSGTIKISTINSFKGWESEVIFLLIEPKYDNQSYFNMAFDELLYTGLTRCRRNLVIINFGNKEYDIKMRPLIEQIKK